MKSITKKRISIYLGAIMAVLILSLAVYAVSREESKSGEPPYGLAIQSDAPGTKLYGVATIDFLNWYMDGDGVFWAEDAKVIFRLRQGSDVKLFTGMYDGELNLSDLPIPLIQNVLMATIEDAVIDYFFGTNHDPNLQMTLKNVVDLEMGSLMFDAICGLDCCNCNAGDKKCAGCCSCNETAQKISYFVVADVELSVK
jgi:hypothetical protein